MSTRTYGKSAVVTKLTNRERLSETARPLALPGPAGIEERAEVRLGSAYHPPGRR